MKITNKNKVEMSDMGEHDVNGLTLKPINKDSFDLSESPNPLDNFRICLWRNEIESPQVSPLKISP